MVETISLDLSSANRGIKMPAKKFFDTVGLVHSSVGYLMSFDQHSQIFKVIRRSRHAANGIGELSKSSSSPRHGSKMLVNTASTLIRNRSTAELNNCVAHST